MNTEQLKIFESFVQEAIQHALPRAPLNRVEDTYDGELVNWPESILVSIMSFQSDLMQGTAVIGCDTAFLEKTYPGLDPNDPNKDALLQDWLGELSNLVLGRLKNKLLPYGIFLKLNPPSVTEASEEIFDSYASRRDNTKVWFDYDHQFVCLFFSIDLDPSINFAAELPQQGHSLQPGDAIYRLNEPQGSSQRYDVIAQIRSGVMTDDDPALHDDFELEFEDEMPSRPIDRRLAGVEQLVNGPAQHATSVNQPQVRQTYPDIQQRPGSASPNISSSSASSLSAVSSTSTGRRTLEAVEWGEPGELCLRFQGGSIVRLSPANLLALGTVRLVVEGYQLEIQQTSQGIRVSLPELQISMEAAIRAA